MANSLHDHQDDSSTWNDKKIGREETIKNQGQHQDQTLPNISPQGENYTLPIKRVRVSGYASQIDLDLPNVSVTMWLRAFAGRVRLYSESQVYTVSRWQQAEPQDGALVEENGGTGDGLPFRGRSQSAPAALWKAKKYGRQLRRMSDEFDTWLDKGVSLLYGTLNPFLFDRL